MRGWLARRVDEDSTGALVVELTDHYGRTYRYRVTVVEIGR